MFTSPELEVARRAATRAATTLNRYFRKNNQVQYKSSWNLVSQADLESEANIIDEIHSAFPDHAILGEEGQQPVPKSEHLWIVDPLDGTNNFCHGVEHFAISIAYCRHGETHLGLIHRPCSDDWFIAARGQGAYANGVPCRIGTETELSEALIGVGFYYDRDRQMKATLNAMESLFGARIHGIRRMGTASLDLVSVGAGHFGGYFEFELAPWDYAAGKLFVEEAGGIVTDCSGNSIMAGNSSIVAGSKSLHQKILTLVQPHFESTLTNRPSGEEDPS